MTAKHTAKEVADCILKFCNDCGDLISNLKLQKLLYYSQAWNLALQGKPLFEEDIEAWVHGPVEPGTYVRFKQSGFKPINLKVARTFDAALESHVKNVMEIYGGMSGFDLERQTHSEPPWQDARKGLAPDESSHNVISKQSMRAYYKSLLKN